MSFRTFAMKALSFIPDKMYLHFMYRLKSHQALNLKNPQTYNEKLQWLKLYNRKPEYVQMVDKYEVKKYIADTIGDKYLIKTLGVYNSFDEIDFDELPNRFVLKCTHDSGSVVFCHSKSDFDKQKAKRKLQAKQRTNGYYYGREWPYKDVKPRIIAEEFLDMESEENAEYKMFCFDGNVKYALVCTGLGHSAQRTNDFFDKDFNHLDVIKGLPNTKKVLKKTEAYDEIVELSEKLSVNIPSIRVDFYVIDGRVYFSELTFFHESGFYPWHPAEFDTILGNEIILPTKTKD